MDAQQVIAGRAFSIVILSDSEGSHTPTTRFFGYGLRMTMARQVSGSFKLSAVSPMSR